MISEILAQTIRDIERHEEEFPEVYRGKWELLASIRGSLTMAVGELRKVEPEALPTICVHEYPVRSAG